MTTIEIAANAIRGMRYSNRLHIDIVETMRTLKLSTDDAVAVRKIIVADWHQEEIGSDEWDRLLLAKQVINQYARDYRLR